MKDIKGEYGPDPSSEKPKEEKKEDKTAYVPFGFFDGFAYEAIHTGALFEPMFLCYDQKKIWPQSEIVIGETKRFRKIVKPVEEIPYETYSFSEEEIAQIPTK